MRKIYLSIFFMLAFLLTDAQGKLSDDQLKVQQALTGLFQAIADKDTVKIKQYCTADIMLLENGEVWNLDTLVQKVFKSKAKDFKRVNTLGFIDTRVNRDLAWVTYNNQAEIIKNEQHVTFVKWLETTILIKVDNQWKVRVLHSTLLKP
ncbi:MAG TPA: nuclear transport factor 2 family protein [Ferruginibacter sp.]|nr:nuclear transport factor 2 family protein [Ferruginibacter sp.]